VRNAGKIGLFCGADFFFLLEIAKVHYWRLLELFLKCGQLSFEVGDFGSEVGDFIFEARQPGRIGRSELWLSD
jgi:hypothetical protein